LSDDQVTPLYRFINDYILNEVGRSPLVSGFFWDDVSATRTAAAAGAGAAAAAAAAAAGALLLPLQLLLLLALTATNRSQVWNPECNIHDQVKNTCEDMGMKVHISLKDLCCEFLKQIPAVDPWA